MDESIKRILDRLCIAPLNDCNKSFIVKTEHSVYQDFEFGHLIMRIHTDNDAIITWACLRYYDDNSYEVLACGDGVSGAMREVRHTYWGPVNDGYIYNPSRDDMIWILDRLSTWFDI